MGSGSRLRAEKERDLSSGPGLHSGPYRKAETRILAVKYGKSLAAVPLYALTISPSKPSSHRRQDAQRCSPHASASACRQAAQLAPGLYGFTGIAKALLGVSAWHWLLGLGRDIMIYNLLYNIEPHL